MPKPQIQLNSEQQEAVDAGKGAFCLVAGAGSGKSTVLLQRYVRLVESGVSPDDILVLTFTAEAAKSLRKRAESLGVEQKSGKRTAGFLTFHSTALAFAHEERDAFPFQLVPHPLATDPQINKSIGEVSKRFSVDPKSLRSYISLMKRTRVTPEEAVRRAEEEGAGEKSALAYKAYESKMIELGVMDFDTLLVQMVSILETNSDVRKKWQYSYCMSDESQDNDAVQVRLLQLLTQEHGNILCVGDGGQNLYSFRGALPEIFANMGEYFPGTNTLYLAKNHRSSKRLVEFLKLVGPIPELAERFFTDNAEGIDPIITRHASPFEEANEIVRQIQAGEVTTESTAILCRTNRGLLPFETALATAGIKYKHIGKSGFYTASEVVSVIAYAQCVVGPHNNAVLSAIRSPFEPTKFLRKKEIADHISDEAKRTEQSIWKVLHSYTPKDLQQMRSLQAFKNFLYSLTKYKDESASEAIKGIIRDTRAMDYYAEGENLEIDNNPTENLGELVKAAARFKTLPEFLDHVRKIQGAAKSKKGLVISTCHGAKGLEWDNVYLVQCSEGILPHSRAESIEEESRVFFVGVSRAAKRLTISYTGIPSRFITRFLPNEPEPEEFWEEELV